VEAAADVTVTGTVEPGSAVSVVFQGATYGAVVDTNGNWSADIPASAIPSSNGGTFQVDVNATDAAGNTSTASDTFQIDNLAVRPITGIGTNLSGVSDVDLDFQAGGRISFSELGANGTVSTVAANEGPNVNGSVTYDLATAVDNLIVRIEDMQGNSQTDYYVFDDGAAGSQTTLDDLANKGLDITAVNLQFGEVDLVLSEQDVLGLSNNSDTLTVFGNANDEVTMIGAVFQGNVTNDNRDTFAEYTFGSATVLIDDDILASNVNVV
jgi:hypothetical protein